MYSSTSTSEKVDEIKVQLVRTGDQLELHIYLIEDKFYSEKNIEDTLKAEIDRSEADFRVVKPELEGICKEIRSFLAGLRKAAYSALKVIHRDKAPIDISLPRFTYKRFTPGEFVGNYIIDFKKSVRVVLHVEPKIGWDAYAKMIDETISSISIIARETGVIEPLLGNLYYPSLSTPFSYSILLNRLTELILSSTPPKKTIRMEIVSEDIIGKPVYSKTLKYLVQGVRLGVYERVRVEPHDYPYMLLARFHSRLLQDLNAIESHLVKTISGEELLRSLLFVVDGVRVLKGIHIVYLNTPPIANYIQVLIRERISDSELIQETRRASRVNPLLGSLADLYEMYLHNIAVIHGYAERGLLIPVASSKIYELWVLTRIIEYLRQIRVAKVEPVRYKDLFIALRVNDIQVIYNELRKKSLFVKKLAGTYHRPDYLLRRGGSTVVYDAKYKAKLSANDVERLVTYIVEFSTPIEIDENKVLVGGFYKLLPSRGEPIELVAVRKIKLSSSLKIVVYVFTLDPRMNYDEIRENVVKSVQILYGTQ